MRYVDLLKASSGECQGKVGRNTPWIGRVLLVALAVAVVIVGKTQLSAQEWDQVVAAAKKEGKVVVAGPPGAIYRPIMKDFQTKYPEIQLEFTGLRSSSFASRVLAERKAGKKLWDVFVGGMPGAVRVKRVGGLAELRPALILPEVKGDKNWYGGVDYGFLDKDKKYVFAFIGELQTLVYVNRTSIPSSQFSSPKQLLDAKFKGKIVMEDPRKPGAGTARMAGLMAAYGENFIKKLFTEQSAVYTRSPRQLVEWLVRGRYPIGIGIRESALKEFRAQGLGKDVEPVTAREAEVFSTSGGNIALIEGGRHPNAAKVYINWLLSKRVQKLYAEKSFHNSRRTDVPVIRPENFPNPKRLKQYIKNDEAWRGSHRKIMRLAKKLIK